MVNVADRIRLWFWTTPCMEFASRLSCTFMHVAFMKGRPRMRCEHGGPCLKGCRDDAEQWKCPACGVEFDNQLVLDDHVEEFHGSYKKAREEGTA